MAFAAWTLTHKRILLGRHRLVAGRLAVTFSTVFVTGAAVIGYVTASASAFAAAGLGVVMLAVALLLLIRARRSFAHLSARRLDLERQLGASRG
jgi:hypothetical protein